MELKNERKETVYKYELDCTDEEAEQLKKIAIERFAKDERAQLEYAVYTILNDAIEDEMLEIIKPKKSKKGEKNGSKNNNRK